MAAANTRLVNLPDPLRRRVEALLLDFEGSWTPQQFAARAAEVGQLDAELRLPALTEMAKVDLELQWRHGNRLRIEDYLARHPELGTADTVPPDLIQAEFEVRQQFGEPASLPDFERRFPRHAAKLRQLVEQARVSTANRAPKANATVNLSGPGAKAAPTSPHQVDDLPAEFGSYRILQRLGKGGMGAVYLAQDTKLNRPVAIKVTLDRDPELLARLREEALAAAKLLHPNICPVYEFGTVGEMHYIALAYIEGKELSKFIDPKRPIPAKQVALLVRKLARALHYAHERGVIHRDLKPANIMMNALKEPVIMDFGLARQTNKKADRLTSDGRVMGTAEFMAPEQVRGQRDAIDHRCDIYALGVVLYELLCGRLPFTGAFLEVVSQVLTEEPKPPSAHRPGVDKALEAICLKAMAKRPEDRYPSMQELAAALEHYVRNAAQPPEKRAGATNVSKLQWDVPVARPAPDAGGNEPARVFAEMAAPPRSGVKAQPARRRGGRWLALAAAGLALPLILGGIYLVIKWTKKDGSSTELRVSITDTNPRAPEKATPTPTAAPVKDTLAPVKSVWAGTGTVEVGGQRGVLVGTLIVNERADGAFKAYFRVGVAKVLFEGTLDEAGQMKFKVGQVIFQAKMPLAKLKGTGEVGKQRMTLWLENPPANATGRIELKRLEKEADTAGLVGRWNCTHRPSGWKGFRVLHADKTFSDSHNRGGTWTVDGGLVHILWPDGGAEYLAIDPDNPNEMSGSGAEATTWYRQ